MSFCSPFPPQKLSSSGCSDILPVLKSPLHEHCRTTQSCASSEDRTAIDLVSSYEVRSALIIVRRIQSSTSVCSSFTSVFSPSTRLHRDSPFIRSTSSCAVYHRLHQRGTTIANLRQLLHSSSPTSGLFAAFDGTRRCRIPSVQQSGSGPTTARHLPTICVDYISVSTSEFFPVNYLLNLR